MIEFQINDTSVESQWRALILFGKNSATYKFAFAKSLLEFIEREKTIIKLSELSKPFSRNIIEHLKKSDKQGNAKSSKFLDACRLNLNGEIDDNTLWYQTEKLGFINVVDAFQNLNGSRISNLFYEKNFSGGKKEIILKDHLLKLKNSFHFQNFDKEIEARWSLVETAWNLRINPSLLEVKYDDKGSLFFLENENMRRKNITSVRDSLNGYQKGKCFYSFMDISINKGSPDICHVDHFLPHVNKKEHEKNGGNINGVWNLVLAHSSINSSKEKGAKIPDKKYLTRLFNRNEFFISSKHPLAETIINQTGKNKENRRRFIELHYNIALDNSIITWTPSVEFKGTF